VDGGFLFIIICAPQLQAKKGEPGDASTSAKSPAKPAKEPPVSIQVCSLPQSWKEFAQSFIVANVVMQVEKKEAKKETNAVQPEAAHIALTTVTFMTLLRRTSHTAYLFKTFHLIHRSVFLYFPAPGRSGKTQRK
jgi:hypothetical protein